jgi:hypothetical protein
MPEQELYDFSIVALPFLKTSGQVRLGGLDFRSTEDTRDLPEERAVAVGEVRQMLFAQNDYRIKAACYALIPRLDLDRAPHNTAHLENIQSVISYLYSSPHQVFGTPFFHSEYATVVLFTPSVVSVLLTRPPLFNVVAAVSSSIEPNERDHVRGYAGLHNFRHHFWVAPGARVYGPLQHPSFNISQDLYIDVRTASSRLTYGSLFRLLDNPGVPAAKRVLTALRWYASANREETDDYVGVVHLAIAFESLLGLPQSEKTDRLVDAISLLLGRVPRLDTWARQFYDARSRIVHEGHADTLRFAPSGTQKQETQLYQSLFSYGSQVFRLCLGTLLVGSELAEEAALAEKFVTNQERYTTVCKVFTDSGLSHKQRFEAAAELMDAVERYRFVGETGLQVDTMIGAVRVASRTLLESGVPLESTVSDALTGVIQAGKSKDSFAELDALHSLDDVLPEGRPADAGVEDVVRRLVKSAWGSLFMQYYWLKKRRTESGST